MRLVVLSLLRSVPSLANVILLMGFLFSIFGVLGLQIWYELAHCPQTTMRAESLCCRCRAGLGCCTRAAV
jgi:hypothetical protein